MAHYIAPPKIPPTIQHARQLRRRIIPLYVHRVLGNAMMLWRRQMGAPITENPKLDRRIAQPPETVKVTRQWVRSQKRELTKGELQWYAPNRAKPWGRTRRYLTEGAV